MSSSREALPPAVCIKTDWLILARRFFQHAPGTVQLPMILNMRCKACL